MARTPKTSRREHSAIKIKMIYKLTDLGYSLSEVARETDVPKSTVHRILQQRIANENRIGSPPKRRGRPCKLDRRAERMLLRHVAQNPFETMAALCSPSKSGHQLSKKTVRKYLAKNEVYTFKPRRKPFLSEKHKRDRLKWAREHVKWTAEDWRCVIFSDESTFELGLDTRTAYVKRPLGKAFESRYLRPTFKSGRSTIGIWGCINSEMDGTLAILPSGVRMNSSLYISRILNEHGHPFYERIATAYGDALWQDDGAKYHTSKVVEEWRKSMLMQRMKWPAQSPDLNPIENLWHIIKINITKRRHRIDSLDEFAEIIEEEWKRIGRHVIKRIIGSMKKRCLAVIRAKGASTKY
jgi:transposase